MISALNKKSAMLNVIKPYIAQTRRAEIGNALINSVISYAAVIWGGTKNENIRKLQIKQTKIAKSIGGWKRESGLNEHRDDLMKRLKWKNVDQIRNTMMMNYVRRALNDELSAETNRMFTVRKAIRGREGATMSIDHKGHLNRKKNTTSERAKSIFNKMPPELRQVNHETKKFKTLIKSMSWNMWNLERHKLTKIRQKKTI